MYLTRVCVCVSTAQGVDTRCSPQRDWRCGCRPGVGLDVYCTIVTVTLSNTVTEVDRRTSLLSTYRVSSSPQTSPSSCCGPEPPPPSLPPHPQHLPPLPPLLPPSLLSSLPPSFNRRTTTELQLPVFTKCSFNVTVPAPTLELFKDHSFES